MPKIKIMINGIPGNVAVTIAKHALTDDRFELIPHSLTGPEVEASAFTVDSASIGLIPPAIRKNIPIQSDKNCLATQTCERSRD